MMTFQTGNRRAPQKAVPRFCRSTTAGFTLIEVLVSVVILATGIVVIIEGLQGAFTAVSAARDTMRMSLLARGTLQEIESGSRADAGKDGLGYETMRMVGESEYWIRSSIQTVHPEIREHFSIERAGTLSRIEVTVGAESGQADYRLVSYAWKPPDEKDDED